jgi:hypothetical protein
MVSFVHLQVTLPKNRNFTGNMVVFVNNEPTGFSFPVKGRGSVGAGNTMFQNKGNTPDGKYRGELVATKGWNEASYGPNGAIRLHPISGNAYKAWKIYGRTGLCIHGGNPPKDADKNKEVMTGGLRPTYGCLRLSNENVAKLMQVLEDAKWILMGQKDGINAQMSSQPIMELAGSVSKYVDGRLFKPLIFNILLDQISDTLGNKSYTAAKADELEGTIYTKVELDISVTVSETA